MKKLLVILLVALVSALLANQANAGVKISNDYSGEISALASSNQTTIFLGGSDGRMWKADNTLSNIVELSPNLPTNGPPVVCIKFLNSTTGFASAGGRLSKTTDGGTTWQLLSQFTSNGIFDIQFLPNNVIIAVTSNSGMFRSTDGGATWINQSPALFGGLYAMAFVGDIGFVSGGTSGNLGKTTNAGVNWIYSTVSWKSNRSAVSNGTMFFAGYNNGACVVRSTDQGQNWIIKSFPNAVECRCIAFQGNIGFLGGYQSGSPDTARAYKTVDGGVSWNEIYVESGVRNFESALCLNGKVYFGANGGYVHMQDIVSVQQIGTEIPDGYSLKQNFPNPFNPTTNIKFSIPKSGMVTLKVYDMTGREAASLLSEVKSAGTYTVDFNASKLSSGTYFYRIETNDFVDTKKMILMK